VRRGQTPGIVLLTDCRANIALDGSGGRARAEEDALRAARGLGRSRTQVLLIDTAPRPQPFARDLQAAMGAAYLALPYSDSRSIAGAARAFVQAPVVRRIT
jgi:magnesium chelatase subunit D